MKSATSAQGQGFLHHDASQESTGAENQNGHDTSQQNGQIGYLQPYVPNTTQARVKQPRIPEATSAINLKNAYPVAFRSVIRRSAFWILSLGLLFAICFYSALRVTPLPGASFFDDNFRFVCAIILLTGVVLLALKFIYEILYFQLYYYGIELDHLVISHGVIIKTRASFPLPRMAGVYIERTVWDLLFGLRNLELVGASGLGQTGTIEGLGALHAAKLQNYLLAMIRTTGPVADEEKAASALRKMDSVTEEPSIAGPSTQDMGGRPPHVEGTEADPNFDQRAVEHQRDQDHFRRTANAR